jgi:hypothetical protein
MSTRWFAGKNVTCTSQELVGLNLRLKDASNECYILSEGLLEELYVCFKVGEGELFQFSFIFV